jgi:plasmid replication initiation protein
LICFALPGGLAAHDPKDLVAYPFFSLAKSRRIEHGMAATWDADVLIWVSSQIVEACDAALKTCRLMAATPSEILTFAGRGTSVRDYDRLKAALDRLQSTTLMTSIRQPTDRRRLRFSWINEWKETADAPGHARGIELILPDWLYTSILNDALVLTIDRGYFDLTGGLECWLYRKSAQTARLRHVPTSFNNVEVHRERSHDR